MASPWYSLAISKQYLARNLAQKAQALVDQPDTKPSAPELEALRQGSVELALRARECLLVMIAEAYQEKSARPRTLYELTDLLGEDLPDVQQLRALSNQRGSWWQLLDELARDQTEPPKKQKTVSEENIIAISAATGPDRSLKTLFAILAAIKQMIDTLADRHDEW